MILGILQARLSSSRLPGKVILPLLGQPLILRQIERLQRCQRLDVLVLATSTEASDDPLADLCRAQGVACVRGSLDDVLDRYYRASRSYTADHIVRLTGDCPLADPAVIDGVIAYHLAGGYDYTSNCIEPTFPDGLDVEVMKIACLEEAWCEADLASQREHVTPFIHSQPERYKLGSYRVTEDYSALRWTVDEPADYEFVCRVYAALYPDKPAFGMTDILALLATNPELGEINANIVRNAGYLKSLVEDRIIGSGERERVDA